MKQLKAKLQSKICAFSHWPESTGCAAAAKAVCCFCCVPKQFHPQTPPYSFWGHHSRAPAHPTMPTSPRCHIPTALNSSQCSCEVPLSEKECFLLSNLSLLWHNVSPHVNCHLRAISTHARAALPSHRQTTTRPTDAHAPLQRAPSQNGGAEWMR